MSLFNHIIHTFIQSLFSCFLFVFLYTCMCCVCVCVCERGGVCVLNITHTHIRTHERTHACTHWLLFYTCIIDIWKNPCFRKHIVIQILLTYFFVKKSIYRCFMINKVNYEKICVWLLLSFLWDWIYLSCTFREWITILFEQKNGFLRSTFDLTQ